ncbi:unnamed protein product [Ectocarpus sp. CCAP 1310/34]|nr:unnamed protein product [Ectocarpus sp. CCAP 1310/34]
MVCAPQNKTKPNAGWDKRRPPPP